MGQKDAEKPVWRAEQYYRKLGKVPAASRYFARIRDELNPGITNRSKITMALDSLGHLNDEILAWKESEECWEYANERFRDFRQLLNECYNKLSACQHGCQFLNLCDYTKVFTLIKDMGIPC